MTLLNEKQLILIKYLKQYITSIGYTDWLIKAEYNTNDKTNKVVVVQEQTGDKVVFYGDIEPMFNYYMIDIYGLSIEECKALSVAIGNLITKSVLIENVRQDGKDKYNDLWQIIFKQYTNPQAIEYIDIKRVGYNMTVKLIVNKVASELITPTEDDTNE